MKIRYCGPKPLPLVLSTPIPFLSYSEKTGQISFNPECEIEDENTIRFLLEECGDAFVCAETEDESDDAPKVSPQAKQNSKVQNALGRKFKGGKLAKWNAKAYLKKHGLEGLVGLKAFRVGDKLIHWEIVPITESSAGDHEEAIPAQAEGQEELNDVSDRHEVTIEG